MGKNGCHLLFKWSDISWIHRSSNHSTTQRNLECTHGYIWVSVSNFLGVLPCPWFIYKVIYPSAQDNQGFEMIETVVKASMLRNKDLTLCTWCTGPSGRRHQFNDLGEDLVLLWGSWKRIASWTFDMAWGHIYIHTCMFKWLGAYPRLLKEVVDEKTLIRAQYLGLKSFLYPNCHCLQ